MLYHNQLVATGMVNDGDDALNTNVDRSFRRGVELMASWSVARWFKLGGNATFSRNRIKNFTEVLYDDNTYERWEINHGSTRISFSPDIIVNNTFAYSWKGIEASLQSQYVGKQYMSNAGQEEHCLDAYFVSNLNLAYTFKLPSLKSVTVGCTIYNLFNEEYENNGYAGSGYYTDGEGTRHRYNYAGYAAQAGINAIGHVNIEL